MASHYVYFQAVPDIAGDERVTFGVATFDGQGTCLHFIRDWSRVRAFMLCDIGFLMEFAERCIEDPPSSEELRKWAKNWHNGIQVTEPRASLLDKNELLTRILPKALTEPIQQGYEITVTPKLPEHTHTTPL